MTIVPSFAQAPAALRLRRVRLRGARDEPQARRWLEASLGNLSVIGLGLPPRALFVVEQVAPAVPLQLAQSHDSRAFRRSVQAELESQARHATRPWLDPDCAQSSAVLFADDTELAACLIRDWLRGTLGASWWAPAVLDGRSAPQWWQRELLPRGDLLPPVLSYLAAQGAAVAWLAHLSTTELECATAAVATAHGLNALTTGQDTDARPARRGALSIKTQPAGPSDAAGSTALVSARRHLAALVPELAAVAGSPPRARLLALALGIQRDPAWVRGAGLRLALSGLESGGAATADRSPAGADWRMPPITPWLGSVSASGPERHARPDPASPKGLAVRSASSLGTTGPGQHSARTAGVALGPGNTDGQQGRRIRIVPMAPASAVVPGDLGDRMAREPLLSREAEPPPGGDESRADAIGHIGTDAAVAPAPLDEERMAPGSRDVRPPVPQGGGQAPEPESARPFVAREPLPSREAEPPPGGDESRADATAHTGTITASAPAPAEGVVWTEPLAEAIETDLGGLLYLLNLALALGLYGDFTQPRRPGIALSPWDWLALVGRAWFGHRVERDPLWQLLARLAGRSPEQPPGLDFAAPPDWSVPPDWLLPWGAAGPVGVQGRGDRLRLWHPAGFLLAELRRSAGIEVLTQAAEVRERWPVLAAASLVRLSRPPTRSRRGRARGGSAQGGMPGQRHLARWLGRLLPYLEARLALALGEDDPSVVPHLVCRHQALIQVSATALDVQLSLAELPIAIRIAGLDRDPGWVPAAGRSIAFHFA